MFLVRFAQPVVYLADSQSASRVITELPVHAPDAESAKIHAIRVVRGDVAGVTVVDADSASEELCDDH